MIFRRDGPASDSDGRGQASLIGIVLLIGMVATLSLSFFLVAGETVASVEQQSEEERIEGAFVELSTQLHTASSNGDISRTIDLDVGQNGAVVREETGMINVTSDALADDAIDNLTIGTVEYESDDGTTIAYEAGAVFRETGNETQVVSEPSIHYDTMTKTLTLPVVTAIGDEELGAGDVRFTHNTTKSFQDASVVEDESVTITIKSEYYRGWESFFRDQAGDTSVRNVDHENETIDVRVGYLDVEEAYEDGLLVAEEPEDGDIHKNAGIDDEDLETGAMPELDEVIDQMVADIENGDQEYDDLPGTDETIADNGTYYTDEELHVASDDRLTFDISDGNSTLIVDDNVTVSGELIADADDTDNELKIYTTGNVHLDAGDVVVDDGTAANLQIYGTSEAHIGFGTGGTTFRGTMYAPRDEPWNDQDNEVYPTDCQAQVCMQSNVYIEGSIIARSLDAHSASVEVNHDTALENNDISLYADTYELPPQLTYLNVAHHEVDVTNR